MKLSDHVDHIRELTYRAFDKQFARLGIGKSQPMHHKILGDLLCRLREGEVLRIFNGVIKNMAKKKYIRDFSSSDL